jgi:hypothetical protein
MFEQSRAALGGYPILPLKTIQHIWNGYMQRGPDVVASMALDVLKSQLHAVLPAESPVLPPGSMNDGMINMGVLTRRHDAGTISWVENAYEADLQATLHPHVSLNDMHNLHNTHTSAINIEAALMPFLFPHGRGQYRQHGKRGWQSGYYKMRFSALFSVFTLSPTYLAVCTVQKYCREVVQNTREATVHAAIRKYKKDNPGAADADAIKHVLKHTVPASVFGSPQYWRSNLLDLLQLVQEWGMPHFFLTLTADECSELRWAEINDLTELLHRFNNSYTFENAPVECTHHFVRRLNDFMDTFILCKGTNAAVSGTNGGVLGRVQHHVTRFECQGRGSLHAHIMIWVHPDDLERTTNEIQAFIPAEYNNSTDTFTPPDAPEDLTLYRLVLRKQLHICRPDGCYEKGHCKYKFPFAVQPTPATLFDPHLRQYTYYRPRDVDRNVVPYHPTVLLLWGGHMNLQRVTNAAWSTYLLKYALKCEPTGNLNLDTCTLTRLGITGLSEVQMQLASAMILSKPISPCEAVLYLLGIQPVTFSNTVTKIDSKPPESRTILICNNSANSAAHPVDKYCVRPNSIPASVTFTEYFQTYRLSRTPLASMQCVGQDTFRNYVYKLPTPAIIRFSDYHPAYSVEGCCYNMLLQKVPFRSETELLSRGDGVSYLAECVARGMITSQADLEQLIDDYTTRHLYSSEKLHLLIAELRKRMPSRIQTMLGLSDEDLVGMDDGTAPACFSHAEAAAAIAQQLSTLYTAEDWYQEFCTTAPSLSPSQQSTFDTICSAAAGLFVIRGGPGTGKTYLTRLITHHHVEAGSNVLLAATTGAAAVRLSKGAKTVHSAFAMQPKKVYMTPLSCNDPRFIALSAADVIIIDEFSMMTSRMLDIIMCRLQSVLKCDSIQQVLQRKKIILVGDPHQLPSVCKLPMHRKTRENNNNVCSLCRVNAAGCWPYAEHCNLTTNIRHSQDSGLAAFLARVQHNQHRTNSGVKQRHIHATFQQCSVTQAAAVASLTPEHTVLCSHHEDVQFFNTAALRKFYSAREVREVGVHSTAHNVPDLHEWVHGSPDSRDSFHRLTHVARSAKVMITSNIDLATGAVNGAIGTVVDWSRNRQGEINCIYVNIASSGETIKVHRTDFKHTPHNNKTYHKSTFPLTLAYAITGHASQGLTLTTPTIVHIRNAFVPGLAYVMLSRVTTRNLLRIVGDLTPDMFTPLPPL